MNFKDKYLKYKKKYLAAKEFGPADPNQEAVFTGMSNCKKDFQCLSTYLTGYPNQLMTLARESDVLQDYLTASEHELHLTGEAKLNRFKKEVLKKHPEFNSIIDKFIKAWKSAPKVCCPNGYIKSGKCKPTLSDCNLTGNVQQTTGLSLEEYTKEYWENHEESWDNVIDCIKATAAADRAKPPGSKPSTNVLNNCIQKERQRANEANAAAAASKLETSPSFLSIEEIFDVNSLGFDVDSLGEQIDLQNLEQIVQSRENLVKYWNKKKDEDPDNEVFQIWKTLDELNAWLDDKEKLYEAELYLEKSLNFLIRRDFFINDLGKSWDEMSWHPSTSVEDFEIELDKYEPDDDSSDDSSDDS